MGSECEFTTKIKQKALTQRQAMSGFQVREAMGENVDSPTLIRLDDVLVEFDKAMLDIRAEQRASLQKELTEIQKQLQDLLKECPLLPSLGFLSQKECEALLHDHSVALDEWYHKVKVFLSEGSFSQKESSGELVKP